LVQDGEKFEINNPKNPNEILESNFWWNRIIHPWDVSLLKGKAIEFHGLGWVSMFSVWVAFARRFASREEMGEKIVLSPKEELEYERIVIKLEEVWGVYGEGETTIAKK